MLKDLSVEILENKPVSSSFYLLKFKYPLNCKPGQFLNVRITAQQEPYLRRPLSVHDRDPKKKEVTLLYKTIGRGTKLLATLKKGAELKVLGPLGNSFDLKGLSGRSTVALIGGGIGFAPLLFLAKELARKKAKITAFMGFKNKAEIYIDPQLRKISSKFVLSTDDGSAGVHGLITSCFAEGLKQQKFDQVFVCGPDPMLKIVQAICKKKDLPLQLSLESIMGCGIGACMCCVVGIGQEYKKVCSDGPVFKAEELKW